MNVTYHTREWVAGHGGRRSSLAIALPLISSRCALMMPGWRSSAAVRRPQNCPDPWHINEAIRQGSVANLAVFHFYRAFSSLMIITLLIVTLLDLVLARPYAENECPNSSVSPADHKTLFKRINSGCSTSGPASCSGLDVSDTCCTEFPAGLILLTQVCPCWNSGSGCWLILCTTTPQDWKTNVCQSVLCKT